MMLRPSPRRSFYIVVSRNEHDRGWCWEIRRKRRPMGVSLRECGFTSHRSAEVAGKDALEDFLNGLSLEATSRTLSDAEAGTKIAVSRDRALRK
jgi:hypothetical protein